MFPKNDKFPNTSRQIELNIHWACHPPKKTRFGGVSFFEKYFDLFVGWLWFFFLRKQWGKTHLLDTLNITIGRMKKILKAFEKKFRAKNEDFHRIFESDFGMRIWNLEKTHALHISKLIIRLVCRTLLIFSRL